MHPLECIGCENLVSGDLRDLFLHLHDASLQYRSLLSLMPKGGDFVHSKLGSLTGLVGSDARAEPEDSMTSEVSTQLVCMPWARYQGGDGRRERAWVCRRRVRVVSCVTHLI